MPNAFSLSEKGEAGLFGRNVLEDGHPNRCSLSQDAGQILSTLLNLIPGSLRKDSSGALMCVETVRSNVLCVITAAERA